MPNLLRLAVGSLRLSRMLSDVHKLRSNQTCRASLSEETSVTLPKASGKACMRCLCLESMRSIKLPTDLVGSLAMQYMQRKDPSEAMLVTHILLALRKHMSNLFQPHSGLSISTSD